jgi:hypothetical protein
MKFLIHFLIVLFFIIHAVKPEVFFFDYDKQSSLKEKIAFVSNADVHLQDDVMITMRAAKFVNELKKPTFNRTEDAQAATSWLLPLAAAPILGRLPDGLALLTVSALGFIALVMAAFFASKSFRSRELGMCLFALLLFNRTSLTYGFTGWEHLFQSFFVVLAIVVTLSKPKVNMRDVIVVAIASAVAFLFRGDCVFILMGLFLQVLTDKRATKVQMGAAIMLFLFIVGGVFAYYTYMFGHFMPTTAKLKIGATPSVMYVVEYLVKNGLMRFSSITICLITGGIFLLRGNMSHKVVFAGVIVNFIYAIAVSDVFPDGRMFLHIGISLIAIMSLSERALQDKLEVKLLLNERAVSLRIQIACVLAIFVYSIAPLIQSAKKSCTRQINDQLSNEAQQYLLAKWIEKHLKPEDGPVGWFYLGPSFHLMQFEAADFLGKADVDIAMTEMKWGPPGHNKWDIEKTIIKWDPQVILFPVNPFNAEIKKDYERKFAKRYPLGFWYSLVVDKNIQERYTWIEPVPGIKWGLLLRKNLVPKSVQSPQPNAH